MGNELHTPSDREPCRETVEVDGESQKIGLEEATEGRRKRIRMDYEEWPHGFGNALLMETGEMGYWDLWDL